MMLRFVICLVIFTLAGLKHFMYFRNVTSFSINLINASIVSCHIISGFKMGVRLRYVAFYAILLVNGLHHLPLFFARIMKSTHYLASSLAALPCRLVRL